MALHIRLGKAEGVLVNLKEGLVMVVKEARVVVAGLEVHSGRHHPGGPHVRSCNLRCWLEEHYLADPCQRRAWLLARSELLLRKDLLVAVGLLAGHCVFSLAPPAFSQLDHHGAPLCRLSCMRTVPISPYS